MKKYIASVTLNGKLQIIKREYDRKQDFYSDLRANGYRVRFISTEEKFDEDAIKYNERCEMNKSIKNAIYASDKKQAEAMNMTVAQFRTWLKNN